MNRPAPLIEPLESRIAPALLIHGANLLGGNGNPTTGETSVGDHMVTLVKVLSGSAIVWYSTDHIGGSSGDEESFNARIKAISISPNTSLEIWGNCGDIIANLDTNGRLSDLDANPANGEDGNVLLSNNLVSLITHPLSNQPGNVKSIITGGTVKNLHVSGYLSGIYAGDGVFQDVSRRLSNSAVAINVGFDVNPVLPNDQLGFSFVEANAQVKSGATISNVTAKALEMQVIAGSGADSLTGKGAKGGSLWDFNILSARTKHSDIPSYDLNGGAGGSGELGGAGGGVFQITEGGAGGYVWIHGGQGGAGLTGAGGTGGSVHDMTLNSSAGSYNVEGGHGGDGASGGKGGSVFHNSFLSNQRGTALVVTGDFTGDKLSDVIVVDTGTGQMVLSKRVNGTNSFQWVEQALNPDYKQPWFFNSKGANPTSAVAYDVDGDDDLDIVVGYETGGVVAYLNDGTGQFWHYNGSGDPETNSSGMSGLGSVKQIVVGNFTSGSKLELAVLTSNASEMRLSIIGGDGGGSDVLVEHLSAKAPAIPIGISMVAAEFWGQPHFLIGTDTGQVWNVSGGITLTKTSVLAGAVNILDVDPDNALLLAGSSSIGQLATLSYGSGVLSGGDPVSLTGLSGALSYAAFIHGVSGRLPIGVLTTDSHHSDFSLLEYNPTSGYVPGNTRIPAAIELARFAELGSGAEYGIVAVPGTPSSFLFSPAFGNFETTSLPFSGKEMAIRGGVGGDALGDGAGGSGGSVSDFVLTADTVEIYGGTGGASSAKAAGNGGSVFNLTHVAGSTDLVATLGLSISGGNAGSSSGAGAGGLGGSLRNLTMTLSEGDVLFESGNGGDSALGNAGSAGSITAMQVAGTKTNFLVTLGAGGAATDGTGAGGNGGSLKNVSYQMDLPEKAEEIEAPYAVQIAAGPGGDSAHGKAGFGGSVTGLNLLVDPANQWVPLEHVPVAQDSTIRVGIQAGQGGDGAIGGAGGNLLSINLSATQDQLTKKGGVVINPVTASLIAGRGGNGSDGVGGDGGSVGTTKLTGVTYFDADSDNYMDPALWIAGGDGGNGALGGGKGGSLSHITSVNSEGPQGSNVAVNMLTGAELRAGHGGATASGDGGIGGSITQLSVSVESTPDIRVAKPSGDVLIGGSLIIVAGAGGDSIAGRGGIGGGIAKGNIAAVDANDQNHVGLYVEAGHGGDGALSGGAGGSLSTLTVNSSVLNTGYAAQFYAGNGGNVIGGAAGALGGNGGSVIGLVQKKDLNSTINVISAGNGGDSASGIGGSGGSVRTVDTIGFIGKPTDGYQVLGVFDGALAQGVFAGRGGLGGTSGSHGSIINVSARQISAIAANIANDGTFAPASLVSGVHADLIGYDIDDDGMYGNRTGTTPPNEAQPFDGFILAHQIADIHTLDANRTAAFTFVI